MRLSRILESFVLVLLIGGSPIGATSPDVTSDAPVDRLEEVLYDRDIRPLLSDRCFTCHGPDPAKRKADLRLDLAESALLSRDGIAALVPGNPEESELWYRLVVDDPHERMPPASSNKRPLSREELNLVRRWIEDGARYEPHWSFVPPERPVLPRTVDDDWGRNEIDLFVLETLEAQQVSPSPDADRSTLLRRLFLDLTGLPPTPEEVASFRADERPDAYERWVGRLLEEEPYVTRYAENLAVPWLDAARYADTSGLHTDAGRQSWAWRDWVLEALRGGMPFDRFLTEQLAGDLLPDATRAQKIASGFNRNHVTTDEGGAINEEYLVEYAVDRTETTGAVFLGLTLGCARCHDHKYDPISQQEFYSLFSYFNSIEEPGLYSQLPDSKRAFEPFLEVPTPEQEKVLGRLRDDLTAAKEDLDAPIEGEEEKREAFVADMVDGAGVEWAAAEVTAMESTGGATLERLDDGSVLATGENPDKDTHRITLETDASDLRLLSLEALHDPSLLEGRVGRAPNGNVVLDWVHAEAISIRDPEQRREITFSWAWADVEQMNGDYRVINALTDDKLGWAVDSHRQAGPRTALFLAQEPFGYEGGTRVVVHLEYDLQFAQHVFGRTRLSLGRITPEGLDRLGMAVSGWYSTATFKPETGDDVFDFAFGPEEMESLDTTRGFGEEKHRFNFIYQFRDERLNSEFAGGVGATYVARRIFAPSPREVEVSIGSDDGFRVYLDGKEIATRRVNRGMAADQDRILLPLSTGEHTVVFKIVNTGGPAGFYWRALRREPELTGGLLAAFLPERAQTENLGEVLRKRWRLEFSPDYRRKAETVTALEKELGEIEKTIPRTMVMKELAMPRETFVLERGLYDHPDEERKVSRSVPAVLGDLPEGAPADRRGLAGWLTSPSNPLVARVAVNRLWEHCFGTGIVATSEDFGMQGSWPSHPELLDWLAVEFRESGWDMKRLLKLIVTSSTYRQSSRIRPELMDRDPDNRLLARYPRRRLGAEQIRDQVLYVAGILVESMGGPSVKPYQPEGLWKEVSMLVSNTRNFELGEGDDLWRRSVYTYWKRAAPPPSMMIFDAPTRESCTIRRAETATPLQALVLWNDDQFVEAARMLAERTLSESVEAKNDAERLARMFVRCTSRKPDWKESVVLLAALEDFRTRYREAPEDAEQLLAVGMKPAPADEEGVERGELAAWTMVASALFSSDTMIVKR